jgi:hypothetical protein
MRAMLSDGPPAANGTITLTGDCGQACSRIWAGAAVPKRTAAPAAISIMLVRLRIEHSVEPLKRFVFHRDRCQIEHGRD